MAHSAEVAESLASIGPLVRHIADMQRHDVARFGAHFAALEAVAAALNELCAVLGEPTAAVQLLPRPSSGDNSSSSSGGGGGNSSALHQEVMAAFSAGQLDSPAAAVGAAVAWKLMGIKSEADIRRQLTAESFAAVAPALLSWAQQQRVGAEEAAHGAKLLHEGVRIFGDAIFSHGGSDFASHHPEVAKRRGRREWRAIAAALVDLAEDSAAARGGSGRSCGGVTPQSLAALAQSIDAQLRPNGH